MSGDEAILIGAKGVLLRQRPLHNTKRFNGPTSDSIQSLQTPYGRIALIAGDDSIFPETFRLAAMTGAEIVISPVTPMEDWELKTGLIERAAENRVNLLAPATGPSRGIAAGLQKDFTVLTEWKDRAFDGLLSQPIITYAQGCVTFVDLFPKCAENKVVSANTDLLAGRPWKLVEPIVQQKPLSS